MMQLIFKACGASIVFLIIILVISLITAIPTFITWNFVMPYLFGLPKINYWEAYALIVLTTILFRPIIHEQEQKKIILQTEKKIVKFPSPED